MELHSNNSTRSAVLKQLTQTVLALKKPHPVRVGMDGVDTAGKTSLADELAELLAGCGRQILRASLDDFHNHKSIRRRKGYENPDGFYEDSYNYPLLKEVLLDPLGPGGSLRFKSVAHDVRRDCEVDGCWQSATQDALLLMDGIFLQRPELAGCFEYVIFIEVSFDTMLKRAMQRDADLLGSEVQQRYQKRYIPGQKRYLAECLPAQRADAVLVNDDLQKPVLRFSASTRR
jgi:uridine kinase